MVVITIFSVGYHEIQPVDTTGLRIYTMLVIIVGSAAVIYVIGGFAQMLLDGDFRQMLRIRKMANEISKLKDHVIVCGYGRMGSTLAHQLSDRNRGLVIIERDEQIVAEAAEDGHLALHGNAIDEEVLIAAGVKNANTLATVLSDDAANVYITITARDLNADLQILARGEQSSTVSKLHRVGANHVVLTTSIGADRLAKLILRPSTEALLRSDELPAGLSEELEAMGLEFDELRVTEDSPLAGHRLGDMRIKDHLGFLIVAVRKKGGDVVVNPPADTIMEAGDEVVVLGHAVDIPRLCDAFALTTKPLGQRGPGPQMASNSGGSGPVASPQQSSTRE
jgi:voltage-gated potassium channel